MEPTTITGISSMATRRLLGDIGAAYEKQHPGIRIAIESVGGVDAAKRVRAGEAFDLVVLASNVMEALESEGHLRAGSRVNIASSGIAVAVRTGTPQPDLANEGAVERAVLAGGRISYSSGPSGNYLKALFARWGIADAIAERTVEAKPGIPVGSLVANGEADLGFQQLSELLDVPGITVVGPLPPDIQTLTYFTAGIPTHAPHADTARAFIAFAASPETDALRTAVGMESPG